MLGKLIKYDLLSMSRILVLIHAFMLILAVPLRLLLSNISFDSDAANILFGLTFIVYTIMIIGVTFATSIVIAVRFYRNLFSDEGYLTQTLPVTTGQHLLAKTISGFIWSFLDCFLVGLSLYIGIVTRDLKDVIIENKADIYKALDLSPDVTFAKMILIFLGLCLISCVCNVITYYASIALGQLFSSHRVVGAVACYFGLTTIISILSFAVLSIAELRFGPLITADPSNDILTFNLWGYLGEVTRLSVLLSITFSILLYVITYLLMKRKLDLN